MFPEYRPGRLPLPDTSYQRRFCAQILIADVMAAYEGGFAIDNHDLAMVTEIELETVNEAARCKLARFDAARGHHHAPQRIAQSRIPLRARSPQKSLQRYACH